MVDTGISSVKVRAVAEHLAARVGIAVLIEMFGNFVYSGKRAVA